MKKNTNGSGKIFPSQAGSHHETSEGAAILKKTNGKSKVKIDTSSYQFEDKLNNKELLQILSEVKNGDFTVRMPIDRVGISGKICDTLNEIISLNEILFRELTLARDTIGKHGKLNHRVELPRSARGSWNSGVDSINNLISDLVHPTIEIAHVISSVAKGNLSQEMPLQIGDHLLQGEFGRIAKEVNDMVKQLNLFSMEVTRVAREVGSEGILGGQAKVKGVAGVWKDLTDSVNQMAGNLTAQVRNIAEVTTAVAKGDLSKKITVDVQGEILELKEYDQHDGGSVELIFFRGNPCGTGSWYRWKTGWTGRSKRGCRYMERSY